jgi:hypothetical protein
MGTIKNALARYDEEHAFLRQLTIPEEDRAKHTSAKWSGEYRWFRSANVVDLHRYRSPVEKVRIHTVLLKTQR